LQDARNGVEKGLCGLCGWRPCGKLRGCESWRRLKN